MPFEYSPRALSRTRLPNKPDDLGNVILFGLPFTVDSSLDSMKLNITIEN